ncbi:unnamed protein product [Schistocephalus solidus]|uniref:Uncharacterized protein n=1 Tax=Schistocephalus solidus TaxID=70667 RepID=A0A183TSK2_SCHSO|nr:unnamed protein product [Schistocephalus solidus]
MEMSPWVLVDKGIKYYAPQGQFEDLREATADQLSNLSRKRLAWRRAVKAGAAMYEANRITAAKAKRAERKSPAPQINTANAQALLTCPRSQPTFRAQIGLVRHLRTQCNNNPTIPSSTPNSANPPSSSSLGSVVTDDGDELVSPKRRAEVHQPIIDTLRQTGQTSHNVVPDGKSDTSVASLCLWLAAPEGVASTHLLQLTLLRESGLAESSKFLTCSAPVPERLAPSSVPAGCS